MIHKVFKKDDQEAFLSTPQELIDDTINKVTQYLEDNFADYLSFGNGQFTISRGSSQIMIIVRPFTENETSVEFISQVVTGAEVNADLMRFLLRKNAELHFGAFGLFFDDTITYSHTIAGSNLYENELVNTLNAVAIIADHYDDKIVELAGGKRASDVFAEEVV